MFEKEAEEYVSNNVIGHKYISKAFQDGAEFGYNKAMDEMQEQGLALQSDMDKTIEQNIALKKELEKANEWHYPSKGEYPKEYKDILICFLTEEDMKDYVRGWYEYDIDLDEHYFKTSNDFGIATIKNVYAWMPLVPPKESE